jgi:hypothetical protein
MSVSNFGNCCRPNYYLMSTVVNIPWSHLSPLFHESAQKPHMTPGPGCEARRSYPVRKMKVELGGWNVPGIHSFFALYQGTTLVVP